MKHETEVVRWLGQREGALLLALMAVSVGFLFLLGAGVESLPSSGTGPGGDAARAVALADGLFAGVFLALAAFLTYLNWRLSPEPGVGWVLAASVLISCQSLTLAGLAVYHSGSETRSTWPLHVVAITALVALALALKGLRTNTGSSTDPLGVGLALGLVAAAGLLFLPIIADAPAPTWLLLTVIVASHAALALAVARNRALSRPAAAMLVVAIAIIATGHLVGPADLDGSIWDVMISLALATAGAAWVMAAFGSLHRSAEHEHRRSADLEESLLATAGSDRDHRERLHELRSTLAGLINASGLLENPELSADVRARLESTMRRELSRMQRLVCDEKDLPAVIDLDEALDGILEVHRLKGRRIDLERSGDTAQTRYDALAEVVGILVDNAATHGGSDDSVVAVTHGDDTVEISVTDHGCGIDANARERIFAWGEHGKDSPGEGIGLNLAQRLVAEGGGTLTCAEPPGGGSRFIISLPATRRSVENDHVSTQRKPG